MHKVLLFLLLIFPLISTAQKQVYIPQEWQQGSLDYSFDRSRESENFIMFWGPLAGGNPTQAPPDIAFNPDFILETAEDLFSFYIDSLKFVPGDGPLISEYKMIIVLLHTWEGLEGWAFGGNYDGTTGAMWMHPHAAANGPTLAHEFTHALQNYAWMMYPGHGFINHSYVGSFWESHAEFMALQRYPEVARQFDISRWMNTAQFHWSSTRHHYQAFVFLQYIKELEGLELINRMWRESNIGEHPLETLKRLTNRNQEELNDLFADYARKNVIWDYEIGSTLREAEAAVPEIFKLNPTIIPDLVDAEAGHYRIQDHRSPQDYGYNIIRLHPAIPDSCENKNIYLKFKGQRDVNQDAGWRYSLITLKENGTPKYSDIYNQDDELELEWTEEDKELFLVVSGAPTVHHNYDWEIGFPKIYRYPYEFTLVHAYADGHQPGYQTVTDEVPGAAHSNGGGFVANTAFAASGAYVGPKTRVLDFARIEGKARLEDYAVIRHYAVLKDSAVMSDYSLAGENALVSGNAKISGFARIWGGNEISDNAQIRDHVCIFGTKVYENAVLEHNTFCWGATLHGNVKLGGDAEYFRQCDAGTYMQVQGAWGRDCDGLDEHPANVEVNSPYQYFDTEDMAFEIIIDCSPAVSVYDFHENECKVEIFPNPASTEIFLQFPATHEGKSIQWSVKSMNGYTYSSGEFISGGITKLPVDNLPAGIYVLGIEGPANKQFIKIMKQN